MGGRTLARLEGGTRGVLAIMAGTAFGQLLAVAASPVLSRLYTPADFGVFSVVNALAMVMGTVMALRFEMAVPLPEKDEDARALLVIGALVATLTTVSATVVLWLVAPAAAAVFDSAHVESWLIWVPLIGAAFAAFRLLNQWALRQRRYAATARRNVVSSVTTVAVQLLAGWRFPGPGGLVAGLGVGQALGAASLVHGSGLRGRVRRSDLLRLARRYSRFPLLLAPAGLMNAAGLYVPVLLVAALYGSQEAGWLGFTQRILALPVTLVGQAVAQVYLGELARERRTASTNQARLFRIASLRLAAVGGLGALLLLVAARPVFPWLFGDAWDQSGAMAQALAVSLALQLVATPLSQTLVVYERIGWQLGWDAGRFALVTGVVFAAWAAGAGVIACVWAFSVASAVAYAVSWWLSRWTVTEGRQPRSAATT